MPDTGATAKPRQSTRRWAYHVLNDGPAAGGWAATLGWSLIALIVLSILFMVLDTVPSLHARYGRLFHEVEVAICVLFLVEYLVRVWAAPEGRDQRFSHPLFGRLRYMVSPMALIDLLAVLPTLLAELGIGGSLLPLRLLRVFRLLKLERYSPALGMFWRVLVAEKRSWIGALAVMAVLLLLSASTMWLLERSAQPDRFPHIPAALWWAMTTMTTVGYGDVVPITPGGRILGALVMYLGLATFGLPAAIFASGFSRELERQSYSVNVALLRHVPGFAGLDPDEQHAVIDAMHVRVVPAGFVLLRAEEQPDGLHILTSGEAERVTRHGEREVIEAGRYFGLEILTQADAAPTGQTIVAITECRLLVLGPGEFARLSEGWPALNRMRGGEGV